MSLLYLASRWEIARVVAEVEVLLVSFIDPWTYEIRRVLSILGSNGSALMTRHTVREHAECLGATVLLDKVSEFQQENIFELDHLAN